MMDLVGILNNLLKKPKIVITDEIPGAPNFTYREFILSQEATRKSIDNIPNAEAWKNIESLAVNILQPVREKFGPIRITSGYRSPQLNISIGGSQNSNHCLGQAADIEPLTKGVKMIDIIAFI